MQNRKENFITFIVRPFQKSILLISARKKNKIEKLKQVEGS